MNAKIIIKKSVELYGEEYSEGSTIPYLCWESHGVKNELFFADFLNTLYNNADLWTNGMQYDFF